MLFSRLPWKSLEIGLFTMWKGGGGTVVHPGLVLITCKRGVKKGGSRVPTSGLHAINACWFLFLLSVYLVVAGAASFDKKSCAGAIHKQSSSVRNKKFVSISCTVRYNPSRAWSNYDSRVKSPKHDINVAEFFHAIQACMGRWLRK